MPETVNNKKVFTLLEVTKSIQKTLSDRYTSSFWVKAEMNKLNFYKQSGHCYPELVEKKDGKVIAQFKSHLWKDDFNRVNNNFLHTLKEPLKDGIKILFEAKISFEPVHGLALGITDIDPSYTLGDLEWEKQETIKQLKEEGIFNKNKTQKLSLLPQRIAIISVETSKGYGDFIKKIDLNYYNMLAEKNGWPQERPWLNNLSNEWGYKYFYFLFPSILQGDNAITSIISQLQRIKKVLSHFDAVAIIRGGGGDIGLSSFNNYNLAKEVALFPIPVLTGIGHSSNETVVEMVSYKNLITPTDLAVFLMQKLHNFSVPVKEAEKKIIDKSRRLLNEERTKFKAELKLFRSVTENILITNRNEVKSLTKSLIQHTKFVFKNENEYLQTTKVEIIKGINILCINAKQGIRNIAITIRKDTQSQLNQFKLINSQLKDKLFSQSGIKFKSSMFELNSIEKNIANMSPLNVLKRGYSITLLNGKAVKSIDQVMNGDTLRTSLFEGNITSIVNSTNKTTEK